ncbi:SRPBCC domain-containing protein [Paenibacillus sp. SC116]|uniref:SRPBCC family protein n=1 Tax=Paenibacillus sp. SC116 TaxID=2968986 RepID=UPI00215A6B4F|nr:SRPBCC domain-containing protein [Paenibacillus sp. SC116]MCR8844565.1 SRPBCC domain-containing protein [Paenibacillus sp. SC116]
MNHNDVSTFAEVRKTVQLNAPIQKVWDAVSTAEGIAVWFMPSNFEPVVGHKFHLEAGPFGKSPCEVTEIDPPNKLSFTWGKDWTLTFLLEEQGDVTEFTLIHGGWDVDKVTEFGQSHTEVRERMSQGWVGIMEKLRKTIEG